MRIISGKNGGQLIKVPKNFKLRPTTDRSKEGVFNIISSYFNYDDLNVLDLFSGTGSISYEFASRGTKKITAIDLNSKHTNFIKSQSKRFNYDLQVIKFDVFKYLSVDKKNEYDIIFLDPPYMLELNKYISIIYKIFDFNMLKLNGFIIVEHSNKIDLDSIEMFYMKRKYGGCYFSIFKNINNWKPELYL